MEPYDIIRKSPIGIQPCKYLQTVPPGLIMEFGVGDGTSLHGIADNTDRTVYGFDSFYGLPEDWGSALVKGTFNKGGKIPADLPQNAECVVGLFQDTLVKFLEIHPEPVAFVHIDSDLYSSASYVLKLLAPRLQVGTILVFDELIDWNVDFPETDMGHWKNGEYKAFLELIEETGLTWECLSRAGKHQVAIKIITPCSLQKNDP